MPIYCNVPAGKKVHNEVPEMFLHRRVRPFRIAPIDGVHEGEGARVAHDGDDDDEGVPGHGPARGVGGVQSSLEAIGGEGDDEQREDVEHDGPDEATATQTNKG